MRHLVEKSRENEVPPSSDTYTTEDILKLLQIVLFVCLTYFLLVLLVTFGSWRRRCNNGMFRLIMFTAHVTPLNVLTYALGLMRESPFKNELFPLWAMLLMVVFGSADSFSAYSLDENEQWKHHNWLLGSQFVLLALVLSSYKPEETLFKIALCLIVVVVLKSHERALALAAASRHSLERSTKVIADYMLEKHEKPSVDAFCMTNCHYLVRGEEEKWENILVIRLFKWWGEKMKTEEQPTNYRKLPKDPDKLITLDKVWNCKGRLLHSERHPYSNLKDYCLSFALCKLLLVKYAGYSLPLEVHQNTRTLIKNELLSQPDDYKRAFEVVERELSYLFDFFYTKYGIIFYPGRLYLKLVEIVYFSMGIWATMTILNDYEKQSSVISLISTVMILAFIAVDVLQLFFTCFSKWTILICICKYVQAKTRLKQEWIEMMVKFMHRVQIFQPWEKKLRQYSFLEFYSYTPCGLIHNRISASYIDKKRDGQKQRKAIKLPNDVKKAVFDKLKSNCEQNGQVLLEHTSLKSKCAPRDLSWAYQFETQTQVIMVWHIATSFCEQQLEAHKPSSNSSGTDLMRNFGIATNLSNYLAYLVVFAPQLLPDHPYTTEHMFDQAIREARTFFKECEFKCKCNSKRKKMKARIDQMKQARIDQMEQDEHSTLSKKPIIWQGAKLGNMIVNEFKEAGLRWKFLANFWVDMMLYVAPSDNAKAHAEHLTKGGEFVTHLWALLHHAGIERCGPSEPTVVPPTGGATAVPIEEQQQFQGSQQMVTVK